MILKNTLRVLLFFLGFVLSTPAIPQNAQQVIIAGQLVSGLGWNSSTVLLNYQEPSTTTCSFQNTVVVKVPKNTTNNTINLATLFPNITTATAYSLADVTTAPGQQVNIGMASSGTRLNMAANGFMLFRVNGSSPTLFADNPSTTTDAYIQVSCLGN